MFDTIRQPNYIFERGAKKFAERRYAEAIADVDKAIKNGFRFSHVYLFRAACNMRLKNFHGVVSDCEMSLSRCCYIDFSDIIQSFLLMALGYACLNNRDMVLRCCQCVVDYHNLYVNACERYPLDNNRDIALSADMATRFLGGNLSMQDIQKTYDQCFKG